MALVGQAALPMGVLCLGAGLQWRAVQAGFGLASFSVITQLLIKPLLFFAMAGLMGLTGDWLLVGLLLMCVSTAPASFILARQLGGDAPLMAGIVVIQTVLAIVSVPLVLWFAEKMNWMSLI
jgi:predicted permease